MNIPDFINSPFLIIDEKGWRLKTDAPKELVEKFEEYMKEVNNHVEEIK